MSFEEEEKVKAESEAEPSSSPWRDYIEAEVERLIEEAGPDLCLAMIHSRAIEHPDSYKRLRGKEESRAHFGITKAGYWERVALRALVLLKVPIAERERLIEEAREREEAARAASRAKIKRGPGGPYREVDLSSLKL